MTLKCQSCGAEARPAFRFCPACGGIQLGPQSFAQVPTPARPGIPTTTSPPLHSIDVSGMQYAGFWRRAAAFALDQLIPILVFSLPLVLIWNPTSGEEVLALNLLGVVVSWLYYALQESSRHQATFGKRLLGLVVANMNGQRLSFARATGHHFARIPSGLLLLVGYFMALFTERRQTLHDKLAGVVVLCRGA